MTKLKSVLGYTWAVFCFLIILATFLGNQKFSQALSRAPFMKINPLYSGGEVEKIVDHLTYKTLIHRPVFEALIGESAEGFVQVKWVFLPGGGFKDLPNPIFEKIDYDFDGKDDFEINLNTQTGNASLKAFNLSVLSVRLTTKLSDGWAVRIDLRNKGKKGGNNWGHLQY